MRFKSAPAGSSSPRAQFERAARAASARRVTTAAARTARSTISFLVDNSEQTLTPATAVVKAFMAKNPNITVKVETRPQGGDGDNIVKTRLATGEMTDVFMYNSGSLFQALSPEKNLVPLTDEPWVKDLQDAFKPSVSAGGNLYGAPLGLVVRRRRPLQQQDL